MMTEGSPTLYGRGIVYSAPSASRAPPQAQSFNNQCQPVKPYVYSRDLDLAGPEDFANQYNRGPEIIGEFDEKFQASPRGDNGKEPVDPGVEDASGLSPGYYGVQGHPCLEIPPLPQSTSSFSCGPGDAPSLATTTNPSDVGWASNQLGSHTLPLAPTQQLKPASEPPSRNYYTDPTSLCLDPRHTFDLSAYNQRAQLPVYTDQQVCLVGPDENAGIGAYTNSVSSPAPPGRSTSHLVPVFPSWNGHAQERHLSPSVFPQSSYAHGPDENSVLGPVSTPGGFTSQPFDEFCSSGSATGDDVLRGVGGVGELPRGLFHSPAPQRDAQEAYDGQINYMTVGLPVNQQIRFPPSWEGIQSEGSPFHYRITQPGFPVPSFSDTASQFEQKTEPFPASRVSATGQLDAIDSCSPSQHPLTPQPSVTRGDRTSRHESTHSATTSTLPSGRFPTRSIQAQTPTKERGKRSGPLPDEKREAVEVKKLIKCTHTPGQPCLDSDGTKLLCATAYFCHLFQHNSSLPPPILRNGPEDFRGTMVNHDLDIAALARKIDELDCAYDVRITSVDESFDVILNMANARDALRLKVHTGPSASKRKSASNNATLNPLGWTACVKGHKPSQNIAILAKLFLLRSRVGFEYVTKDSYSTSVNEIQGQEDNRALGDLFHLLCQNLEIETWGMIHDWLYKRKGKGVGKPEVNRKKGNKGATTKTSPSSNATPAVDVQASVVDLLTLLFALKRYFRFLVQGPIKLRVGELCRRLCCYYLILKVKTLNLGEEDVRVLSRRLKIEEYEIPSDRSLHGFYTWMGASDDDVRWWEQGLMQWWEQCIREETQVAL